jgi:ABC-2 type transport system ATP-binding protein
MDTVGVEVSTMGEPAIRTAGLTKHFGDVVALDNLTLEVQQGEIFGFLGPNGAGKSTTIRLLLNLIRPTAGEAWVMGIPVTDVAKAHRHVTYVPGDVALWPQLTGTETLDLLGNISGNVDGPFRDELIERLQLDPSKRVRSYSKGNRQKIALVAAFMTRPDVLLLDEPTAGLDPLMEDIFQSLAREATGRGQTIFLSSHILDEVEDLCHRVAILREGQLIEVATLDQLQELDTTVFDIEFAGSVPTFVGVAGVLKVEPSGGGIRVTVKGSPAPLLAALAYAPVTHLRTHTPSLEEIFLSYY